MGAATPVFLGEDGDGRSEAPAGNRAPSLHVVGDGETAAGASRQHSVLLVEDDPSMRLLCTFNLELAGFHVTTAETGRQGVELATAEQFDVVLLDVMLPDLGGFEIAEQLNDVPVVFISARASDADLERGREVGAIDYVMKPFDPVSLPARLQEDLEEFARGGAEGVWELRFGTTEGRAR